MTIEYGPPWEGLNGETLPETWLKAYDQDPSTFWKSSLGHLENVIDHLIDRVDDLTKRGDDLMERVEYLARAMDTAEADRELTTRLAKAGSRLQDRIKEELGLSGNEPVETGDWNTIGGAGADWPSPQSDIRIDLGDPTDTQHLHHQDYLSHKKTAEVLLRWLEVGDEYDNPTAPVIVAAAQVHASLADTAACLMIEAE